MFQPHDRRIQGFRCTHQLSLWLSDYGYAMFLPFSGEADPAPAARASSYRPEDARQTLEACQTTSRHFYVLRFDKKWKRFELKELKGHRIGVVRRELCRFDPVAHLLDGP
jgi:hypothetical protein